MVLHFKGRDNEFYRLLTQNAELVFESSALLQAAIADPATFREKLNEVICIEHKADEVTKAIIEKLHKTLVTPMDREDIYQLATILDDIVDFVQGAFERMVMYKATEPIDGVKKLAGLLHSCIDQIRLSVSYLASIQGNLKNLIATTEQISQLEIEGDKLYRQEVGKLFEEEINPIEIIKWKEILEHFEDALDKCEDWGNAIKGVVLKYA